MTVKKEEKVSIELTLLRNQLERELTPQYVKISAKERILLLIKAGMTPEKAIREVENLYVETIMKMISEIKIPSVFAPKIVDPAEVLKES